MPVAGSVAAPVEPGFVAVVALTFGLPEPLESVGFVAAAACAEATAPCAGSAASGGCARASIPNAAECAAGGGGTGAVAAFGAATSAFPTSDPTSGKPMGSLVTGTDCSDAAATGAGAEGAAVEALPGAGVEAVPVGVAESGVDDVTGCRTKAASGKGTASMGGASEPCAWEAASLAAPDLGAGGNFLPAGGGFVPAASGVASALAAGFRSTLTRARGAEPVEASASRFRDCVRSGARAVVCACFMAPSKVCGLESVGEPDSERGDEASGARTAGGADEGVAGCKLTEVVAIGSGYCNARAKAREPINRRRSSRWPDAACWHRRIRFDRVCPARGVHRV